VEWRKADDVVLEVGRNLACKNYRLHRRGCYRIGAEQSLPVTRGGKEPLYDDWHASAGRDKSSAALSRPFAGMQPL
jgi:hypothetical protein